RTDPAGATSGGFRVYYLKPLILGGGLVAPDLDRLRLIVHFSDSSQVSYPLEIGAYSIGSNKNCTIRLSYAGIADVHSILTIAPTQIFLESHGASGSLALSGLPVTSKVIWPIGEEVTLGPYRLCLIELSPPRDVATCDISPDDRKQVETLWRQH